MNTADFGDKDARAVTYGISLTSPLYGLGWRMKSLSIDTSKRPYITFDDGAATHNCIKFGTGNDISMYFDATNLIMAGASERVGKFTLDNVEFNIGEFASAAQGSGVPISSTYSAAFRAYSDDDGTVSTLGSVSDVATGKFRHLSTVANVNHLRRYGVMGQIKAYDSSWATEQVGAVYGYLELVRAAGTISFGAHGVSAGVLACVETAGDMTIAANHILAGVSAISKLSSSGTLIMSGDSAGFHCGIYDSTNWSASLSLDKWKYGLLVEGASATVGGLIGGFGSSAVTTSAIPFSTAQNIWSDNQLSTFEVHGSSASDLTSAYCAKVGRFRHVVTLTSSGNVAHETYGLMGQCVVKEATLQHLHAGLIGTFEGHTSGVVINGSYTFGAAGVMARVGGGGAITATKQLAGVVSFWNGAALASGASSAFASDCLTTNWTYWGAVNNVDNLFHVTNGTSYAHGVSIVDGVAGDTGEEGTVGFDALARVVIDSTAYYIALFDAGSVSGE